MTSPESQFGASITARIDALARFTDEPGVLTRLYLSPAHRKAADQVMAWMRDAGMAVHCDAVGTVIGRYEATKLGAPALMLGSHIDTVRDAGRFDGNLGVLTAIAVVEHLHAERRRLPFAIEVVAFGDEEGVRFPSTLGGSRALAGQFEPKLLDEVDQNGVTRRQALLNFGCDPNAIVSEARKAKDCLGYIEVHIEQGPVLEAEDAPVAVVTAINGASRGTVKVTGESGHAGTVPMALRHDALAAAAEMVLAVEATGTRGAELVATVGRLEVANGATNTVAGSVTLTLDVRSSSDMIRKAAVHGIEKSIGKIAKTRGVTAKVAMTYDAPAAISDARLSKHLAAAITAMGYKPRSMPSGAGHDAMAFAGKIPFSMLFVRCKGGISHNPAEFASPADIDVAARVLLEFVETFTARP